MYAFLFVMLFSMMAVPTQRIDADLSVASRGRIVSTLYVPGLMEAGGNGRFVLLLTADVTASDAATLACTVVRPILAREGYQTAAFELDSPRRAKLATDATPCP